MGTEPSDSNSVLNTFRRRFWQQPRAHGEVIEDRQVSFLELFYDLIYVVVIARAAHTLAENVTWRRVGEFAVVFGMIWIAWMNGTLYEDLHGREDGRSRTFVFLQMLILALLAVYTADATGEGGRAFALVYTAFLLVMTWLWYTVRRRDPGIFMALTARYLAVMAASVVLIGISAALPDRPRLIVWAVFVASWVVLGFLLNVTSEVGPELGVGESDSLAERFGLFTIIVLGEVVVGVVTGLSEADRDFQSVATGLIGLTIGFGIWWTYFDFVGRRLPRLGWGGFSQWLFGHLPVTLSIAASGAAMVSLIEHSGDARAPANSAWLLTGSVALGLLALVLIMHALRDFRRLASVYHPLSGALALGAIAALLAGWWRPVPWALVLVLTLILTAVWLFAVNRWLKLDKPDEAHPS